MNIWLVAYLIPILPVAWGMGQLIYGRWNEGMPPRKPGSFQSGNPRTAAFVGLVYGLIWPVFIAVLLGALLAGWFEAGGK